MVRQMILWKSLGLVLSCRWLRVAYDLHDAKVYHISQQLGQQQTQKGSSTW